MGLSGERMNAVMEGCEFIGLGSFCAVSRALQALGVKKVSYPLDWTRSPIEGVIHLIDTEFADFLTHTVECDKGRAGLLLGGSDWGGSFWHHDIRDPKVRADMQRRIERFYGRREVPATKPRMFVRAVNSTSEVLQTLRLAAALRRALPRSTVYLLICIDNQSLVGPLTLTCAEGEHVLFYTLHESLYDESGAPWTMERQSEAYAEAMAYAARLWAGQSVPFGVEEVPSLEALHDLLAPFHGGDPRTEMFWPHRPPAPLAASVSFSTMPCGLATRIPVGSHGQLVSVSSFGSYPATVQECSAPRLTVPRGVLSPSTTLVEPSLMTWMPTVESGGRSAMTPYSTPAAHRELTPPTATTSWVPPTARTTRAVSPLPFSLVPTLDCSASRIPSLGPLPPSKSFNGSCASSPRECQATLSAASPSHVKPVARGLTPTGQRASPRLGPRSRDPVSRTPRHPVITPAMSPLVSGDGESPSMRAARYCRGTTGSPSRLVVGGVRPNSRLQSSPVHSREIDSSPSRMYSGSRLSPALRCRDHH